ncbi:MAG: class I SAM-dependent methyltransferase [Actinomycetota bacterium]
MNEERLMATVQGAAGHLVGAAVATGVMLGDRLGAYRALSRSGPQTAAELAEMLGVNGRLLREWLDGQAAAGIVGYDPDDDTYDLSVEAAIVYADDTSPMFLARGYQGVTSIAVDIDKIEAAFRGDGGLPWEAHHHSLFHGIEWFFRTGYRAHLATEWIPSLDGVEPVLTAGCDVLDVGCGHGASLAVLAEAYPDSRFHGVDFHEPSIEIARERVAAAGVGDRVALAVGDATSYGGEYDLICFFDCLHDLGDPVGAAAHARAHLTEGGSVLLVEPFAMPDRVQNIAENPMAAASYHLSSMVCTPNSLSQDVGLALGSQAGAGRMAEVFADAGFGRFEQRMETPFNLIFQAKAATT